VRRHAKAPSSRSNARKPTGRGGSPGTDKRLRLALLLATAAAFLLVPAAQAMAWGTTTVEITGTGNGHVSGVGGFIQYTELFEQPVYETNPPVECSYESPGPATGVCSGKTGEAFGEEVASVVVAHPARGSEFAGWTGVEGNISYTGGGCKETPGPWGNSSGEERDSREEEEGQFPREFSEGAFPCLAGPNERPGERASNETEGLPEAEDVVLKVTFQPCTEASEEIGSEIPSCEGFGAGPTNRRLLTVHQSGNGTVSTKPKGIKCGPTCSLAEASMFENSVVTVEAKAGSGATFTGWSETAGTCTGTTTPCQVTMLAAKSLTAAFSAGKAIVSPQTLTLTKAGTGSGTVKATGITCEAECTKTAAAYFGGETSPPAKKAKAAALVTLKQAPAFGSSFGGWTGCTEEKEGNCIVSMSAAKEVTAEYTLLPTKVLSVSQSGNGTVSTKPKGIKCGPTCSAASAGFPEGALITVEAKAGSGATFTGWSSGAGTCTGTTTPCQVTMSAAKSLTAAFSAGKAIVSPQTLTLTKAGTGSGTVKATGLTCEVLCTSTSAAYFGGETSPPAKKAKAAALVTLSAVSAPGSQAVVWSGCTEEKEGHCIVSMSAAKEVTATFDELP
jgi:hypothetical protein